MNLDNIIISKTQPKQTNSIWIDVSDNEHIGVRAFVNGKWTNITAGITDLYIKDIDNSNISEETSQTIHLKAGSNLIGTYIDTTMQDIEDSVGTKGKKIQSQNSGYIEYNNGTWTGALSTWNKKQSYNIIVSEPIDIVLTGYKINEDMQITLHRGSNWINYPFEYEMNVDDALAHFDPQDGDEITDGDNLRSTYRTNSKHQSGFWDGTLKVLKPGQGYIYKSTSQSNKTVYYKIISEQKVVKDIAVDDHDIYVTKIGVDNEPIEGSGNLITSGAVYAALHP